MFVCAGRMLFKWRHSGPLQFLGFSYIYGSWSTCMCWLGTAESAWPFDAAREALLWWRGNDIKQHDSHWLAWLGVRHMCFFFFSFFLG